MDANEKPKDTQKDKRNKSRQIPDACLPLLTDYRTDRLLKPYMRGPAHRLFVWVVGWVGQKMRVRPVSPPTGTAHQQALAPPSVDT